MSAVVQHIRTALPLARHQLILNNVSRYVRGSSMTIIIVIMCVIRIWFPRSAIAGTVAQSAWLAWLNISASVRFGDFIDLISCCCCLLAADDELFSKAHEPSPSAA